MEKREYIEGQLLYIAHPYGGDEKNKERVQTYLKMLQANAYVMDMQIYEIKPTGEICSVE